MLPRSVFFKLMSFYPPYIGAGVRLVKVADDLRTIRVEMGLHSWNRNYVGTQFGGSLYSMVDPFYMLMLMENLGSEFIIWDKAATIRFKKPGRGKVYAQLEVSEEVLQSIRDSVVRDGKCYPVFLVKILNGEGEVIAEVEKTLSVRPKRAAQASLSEKV